jgi:hypothetical protein
MLKYIAMTGVIVLLVWLGFPQWQHIRQIRMNSRQSSKMMRVRTMVAFALSDYYETNRAYPKSLEELPAGLLHWGNEGSTAADLNLLRYHSTSNSFTLVWERRTNYHLFIGGRTGELYWSKADFDGLPQPKIESP